MRNHLFVALTVVAGCGDNLPAPDGDPEPPVETGRMLTGSQVVSYRHVDGAVLSQSPIDLWSTVIEAHVPDGDSWRVVPGTGHRDGSFEIPGVPDGAAWLRVARRPFGDSFYWTGSDHVSFDESVLGAQQPRIADEGDHLGLAVDGLAAWQEGDELAWFIPDDDVFSMNLLWERPPSTDATAVTGTSVDWSWRPLADASASDPSFLVQYRTQELAPGVFVRAPIRATATPLHQAPGIESTLTATLSTPPALQYHLAWALDAFEAQRRAAHPTRAGRSYGHGFALFALPGLVDGELWTGSEYPVASLADPTLFDGTAAVDLGQIAIPNPYPRSWLADLYVVTFPVEFPLPDGTPMTLEAALGRRSAALTDAGPATPLVTAARTPQIAGRDAFDPQAAVGVTPEIRWEAPATGAATSYRLQIIQGVTDAPPPYRPGWYVVAELFVPGDVTSIRLPADVLRMGATYGVVLRTFSQPGHDLAARPFQSRGTAGFADTILGPFTP